MKKCPTCDSQYPHRHPATSYGGEVETCIDDFHLTPTSQNVPKYIALVHEKRARLSGNGRGSAT